MVAAATGSGKTASFMLPALHRILAARGDASKRREKGTVYGPRVLVLTPTRELAIQVAKAAETYGRHVPGLRVATVVGGVPYGAQLKALRGPLDVLIATPGRLLDHLQTGKAELGNVEMLVLDEADRMLDMGFIDDIRTIADHVPAARQTLMYSATFVGNVGHLAQKPAARPAEGRGRVAHRHPRQHRAAPALGRRRRAQERAARPHPDPARARAGAGLHQHPARCRLAGRPPGRHGPPRRLAARRHPQGRRNRVLQGLRDGR